MSEEDFNNFGLEVLTGIVGEAIGTMLYQHLKNSLLKPLTAEEIINCNDFDALVKEKLTKYISKNKNHLELIDITLTDIIEFVKKKEPTSVQSKNVVAFLELLPPDMSLKFMEQGASIDNFIPIVLELMPTTRNDFTLSMITAMGYPEGVISENLEKLDKIVDEYEKEKAKS